MKFNLSSVIHRFYLNHKKGANIFAFSMILMMFYTVVPMIYYSRDDLGDIISHVFCMIGIMILLTVFSASLRDTNSDTKHKVLFRICIYFSCLTFLMDSVMTHTESLASEPEYIYTINTLVFTFTFVTYACFIRYFFELFDVSSSTKKKLLIAFSLSCTGEALLIIMNLFSGILFFVDEDCNLIYPETYSYSYVFYLLWGLVTFFYIIASRNTPRIKFCILSYFIALIATVVLDNIFVYYNIPFESGIINSYFGIICLLLIYFNIIDEKSKDELIWNARMKELQAEMMYSEVKSHFISDAVLTIQSKFGNNPDSAQDAALRLSEHIKENFKVMTVDSLVPFEDELERVKKYLWFVKLDAANKLNIVFDIRFTDFKIPPMTIQPLVANAVEHGLKPSENIGTLTISSHKSNGRIVISVNDNGVGFDTEKVLSECGETSGMNNIRIRLERYKGTFSITSVPKVGTSAVITIKN